MARSFLLTGQDQIHRFSAGIMGTEFNVLLYGDYFKCEAVSKEVFDEIRRIDNIFSNYKPDSEVSRVNLTYKWQVISQELADIIAFSELIYKSTNGAFDTKIGMTTFLWKKAIENNSMPDQKLLTKLKSKRPGIRIKAKNEVYKLKLKKYTKLDFGGIVKGYAVDRAFELLQERGLEICLIDGGGDIRMGNPPPGKEGWKIEVMNGTGKLLILSNVSIASSGNEYQFLKVGDVKYSHIIDPRTLMAKSTDIGVTVIAKSCKSADAMATALSVNPNPREFKVPFEYKTLIKKGDIYLLNEL